ncbi:MAG: hypothetical protein M9928_02655 [Anaerolineae bacterium]|nr:hypothetical protein [Anaerolineae bacterium]
MTTQFPYAVLNFNSFYSTPVLIEHLQFSTKARNFTAEFGYKMVVKLQFDYAYLANHDSGSKMRMTSSHIV